MCKWDKALTIRAEGAETLGKWKDIISSLARTSFKVYN